VRELADGARIQRFMQAFGADLVESDRLRSAFDAIEPQLYRFPAIDPADFRRRVEEFVG
jgi:hypothetical protein